MTLWATSEQAQALNRFRIEHGRAWKTMLRRCWQAATYPSETPPADVPLLQALRNSFHFGPAGLLAWPDVERRRNVAARAAGGAAMIVVLGWDGERNEASIELHAEGPEESCADGYRLVRLAMRHRQWRAIPGHEDEPDGPDAVLSFFGQAFEMLGYRVELRGDIVDVNARTH